ncbi:unnamed protein product [Durusdinium trenchii]|uniref:Uncharacterized protein n=1 Tax=Durusdinium trenchii TaxID=1381693 RepID=A0ABP0SQZ3_9DINO
MLLTAVLATVNRVFYKVALVPLGDYVFFLAQFTTFGYVFVYWSAFLFNRSRGAISDGQLSFAGRRWQTFAWIGALEAGSVLLGMLSAKSLPGEILPVLSKLFLVFQMAFSKMLLKRRYSQSQLSGCALCVLGVVASAGSSLRLRSFDASPAVLFILSLALPALASVLKEKLFADARATLSEELNVFVVNTLGSSCQAVCVLLLLPVLAELQGVGDIREYLEEGASAFLSAPIWPCFYLAVNLFFNVSVLILLRTTSAVSVSLAMALAVPITALVFASWDDVGPFKAQFSTPTPDMSAMLKLGGGLLLTIGMMLSGVSWNPINGKMAGFAGIVAMGYIAYHLFQLDGIFVPRLLYVYAFVVFLGALHICAFPSNPMPKKTKETKNNHGNFSDVIALSLIAVALSWYFYPQHLYQDLGPLKAQFRNESADLSTLRGFVAQRSQR